MGKNRQYELRPMEDEIQGEAHFLEGCLDEYIIKKKINISEGAKLNKKVIGVADHLVAQNKITDQVRAAVNKSVSSVDHVSSINTFHAYVHNSNYEANPRDMKRAWNNLEKFFKAMDGEI
jgi:hypothetical protein